MTEKHPKFQNPPLVHVLAAIRINPVGEIESYIGAITKALRNEGYLDRLDSEHQNYNIELGNFDPGGEAIQVPKVVKSLKKSWIFVHKLKTQTITVSEDLIAFQSSVYSDFEAFHDELMRCFDCIQACVEGSIKQLRRLGLRYVNLMSLGNMKSPSDWICKELLGCDLNKITDALHYNKIERLYIVSSGNLAVRYSDLPGQQPIPTGINPLGLAIPKLVHDILSDGKARFGLLDLDCYSDKVEDLNIEKMQTKLQDFNHSLQSFFGACTTDEAKELWGIVQ